MVKLPSSGTHDGCGSHGDTNPLPLVGELLSTHHFHIPSSPHTQRDHIRWPRERRRTKEMVVMEEARLRRFTGRGACKVARLRRFTGRDTRKVAQLGEICVWFTDRKEMKGEAQVVLDSLMEEE